MKMLVTGGAGFIGSHTVDLLLEHGHQVRVLDSLQPRVHPRGVPPWLSREAELVQGDVANRDDLARALEGIEGVFHLAAYQDYMPDFSSFLHTNATSSALLFELIVADPKRFPVQKIVFASSQSVCGEGRYLCPQCAGGIRPPTIPEQFAAQRGGAALPAFPSSAVHTPSARPVEQLRRGDWELHCPTCDSEMVPLLIGEDIVSPGTPYAISKYAIELLADRLGRR
jgi:dTDP-L-rhamnose 4-epimerase